MLKAGPYYRCLAKLTIAEFTIAAFNVSTAAVGAFADGVVEIQGQRGWPPEERGLNIVLPLSVSPQKPARETDRLQRP